jgi:NTP pyrophosphatase (non-canonical NTP hydrolase)
MTDFVTKVLEFNQVAGTTGESFEPRKTALYMGLVLEEAKEMLEAIPYEDGSADQLVLESFIAALHGYSDAFKQGRFDRNIEAMDKECREEALDAFADIAVVALGGGIATGSDIFGAVHEVADNNLSKFPIVDGVRTALKDENGKVRKPEGYKPPELGKYLR